MTLWSSKDSQNLVSLPFDKAQGQTLRARRIWGSSYLWSRDCCDVRVPLQLPQCLALKAVSQFMASEGEKVLRQHFSCRNFT